MERDSFSESFSKNIFHLIPLFIITFCALVGLPVSVCLKASVSLKRLRVFLSHEELQEDSVEHKAVAGCKSLASVCFAGLHLRVFGQASFSHILTN